MNIQNVSQSTLPKKRRSNILIAVLVSIIIACLCSPLGLLLAGRLLLVNDPLSPADVVVALGGDATLNRLEKAVALYKEGYAEVLVITETNSTAFSGQQESLYLRNQAIEMGVPNNAILVTEMDATSTWDEARAVRKLMLRNGWTSCIAISDPYHTRRVKLAFSQDFKEHDLSVSVTYTPEHWYRPSTWFLSTEGRQTTLLEYIKLFGQLFGFENYELE